MRVRTAFPGRLAQRAGALTLVALCSAQACAAGQAEIRTSGSITYGQVVRVQQRDPGLLFGPNAAAIGVRGSGGGSNADDANTNYGRHDAASRAIKGWFEVSATQAGWSALLRVKAWRDVGLLHDARPWGNLANAYAAGQPLSDAGAPRLSRFSGVVLLDAWLQGRMQAGDVKLMGRIGQQTLAWGTHSLSPGGLEALNPRDLPAQRRAGSVPAETVVPRPMLFGRIEPRPGFGLEAFYQSGFRPTAFDMCGTLWSMSDYLVDGCNRVMAGAPFVSDRARMPLGAYIARLPTPKPAGAEFGFAATWSTGLAGTTFGLYHARHHARAALPVLRRSLRPGGPALIAGDPDGANMAYFTEHAERLRISALTVTHQAGPATLQGELSYRPAATFMLAPGDVLPPFLNAGAPSQLRARADAVAPGGVFRGYDLHPMWQAQLGLRSEAAWGGLPLATGVEVVGKRAQGLPAPDVLRYGRADVFGVGPVAGACTVTTADAARQCSLRGYVTPQAWGYRLRLDARLPSSWTGSSPQLQGAASVVFAHDVRGWSGDFLLNEGRKTLGLGLRFEYRQRYLAEFGYSPGWGGDYHAAADRDTASLALGLKF